MLDNNSALQLIYSHLVDEYSLFSEAATIPNHVIKIM